MDLLAVELSYVKAVNEYKLPTFVSTSHAMKYSQTRVAMGQLTIEEYLEMAKKQVYLTQFFPAVKVFVLLYRSAMPSFRVRSQDIVLDVVSNESI